MKKQVKLRAQETAATNRDFYNLFRPIAPSIDLMGKIAQVISGLTEAVTIWYITQSELSSSSKTVSIAISIVAMLLVVAILELGGRKFLQVLTRALIWKKLQNVWYIALFSIVTLITVGLGVLSFNLSTNGIQYTFESNVPTTTNIDVTTFRADYRQDVEEVSSRFDQDLKLLKSQHNEVMNSTLANYDARIQDALKKAEDYKIRYNRGATWASSHVEKYNKQVSTLQMEKTSMVAQLNKTHTEKIDRWQLDKNKALEVEKANLNASIAKAESNLNLSYAAKYKQAAFWGYLLSWFVGFSVILAFICIVTTEIYLRGSGIEIEYDEEEQDLPIVVLFWKGFLGRLEQFFRNRAERFADLSHTSQSASSIGFKSTPVAYNQSRNNTVN